MLYVCIETSFEILTNKRKFWLTNKYIVLPHPLFSMAIYFDALKELNVAHTVANTFLLLIYTFEEVIEIHQSCMVIPYLLKFWYRGCTHNAYFIDFSPQKCTTKGSNSFWCKSLDICSNFLHQKWCKDLSNQMYCICFYCNLILCRRFLE